MFWNKKKTPKDKPLKPTVTKMYGAILSVPGIPERQPPQTAKTRKETAQQVAQRMGGAQAIAAVIRTMLAEDADRRRRLPISQADEEEEV